MLTITLFIFNVCLRIIFGMFELLPSLDFLIPDDLLSSASDFLNGVAFFLPIGTLATIFEIKITIINVRIAWSLFLRIKSFIPSIAST